MDALLVPSFYLLPSKVNAMNGGDQWVLIMAFIYWDCELIISSHPCPNLFIWFWLVVIIIGFYFPLGLQIKYANSLIYKPVHSNNSSSFSVTLCTSFGTFKKKKQKKNNNNYLYKSFFFFFFFSVWFFVVCYKGYWVHETVYDTPFIYYLFFCFFHFLTKLNFVKLYLYDTLKGFDCPYL